MSQFIAAASVAACPRHGTCAWLRQPTTMLPAGIHAAKVGPETLERKWRSTSTKPHRWMATAA